MKKAGGNLYNTFIKDKKNIAYIYLIIITIVVEIFLYTNATPYEAINDLRIYCYIVMGFAIMGWLLIRSYKVLWVNAAITVLFLSMITIQHYKLPQLSYADAEHLVVGQYKIIPETSDVKIIIWSEKGTDFYMIPGYLNGEKRFYSVNPITQQIKELDDLESPVSQHQI